MSASVEVSIPLLPSARKPGFEPPLEYVQILDMGGELATLNSIKDIKVLKAAAKAYKARTLAELCTLIDARFAVNIKCDSDAIYAALDSPEKSFMLAKLIYNSDKFDWNLPLPIVVNSY